MSDTHYSQISRRLVEKFLEWVIYHGWIVCPLLILSGLSSAVPRRWTFETDIVVLRYR